MEYKSNWSNDKYKQFNITYKIMENNEIYMFSCLSLANVKTIVLHAIRMTLRLYLIISLYLTVLVMYMSCHVLHTVK